MSEHPVERVDAVVVGSGFGGAVTAARLAQAGLSVQVLERGHRWRGEDFPRDPDLKRGWLWGDGRGLFDVRWLDRMLSVSAAGWGGGSLVYANVFARPPAEVFEDGWPDGTTRAGLDPYYDLVGHMQDVAPVGPDPQSGRPPDRTLLLEEAVAASGRRHASVRPNLAVRFGSPDDVGPNRHGAVQAGCRFVGECVVGCPHLAKTTLDLTYLFVAERAGALARCDTEVTAIRPVDGGYRVTATDHARDEAVEIEAGAVFLGAGAVGTTELLLRMRDVAGSLPDLSPALGRRFSGNGDYLSFVRRRPGPERLDRGPTITSTSIMDCRVRGRRVWFQLQDGNYPAVLAPVIEHAQPAPAAARLAATALRGLRRVARRPAPPSTVMTLLLMGRDSADGRLVLDHHDEAAVEWDNRANAHLYGAEGRVARAVGRRIGARVLALPTWSVLRRAVTVHNLGGTPVGTSRADGVVDTHGEVFGYPGLYVVDGAAVPAATGVNPSATIAAVAERRVERFVRRHLDDDAWSAPETADVRPLDVPEDVAVAAMRAHGEATAGGGVRFSELMVGTVGRDGRRAAARLDLVAHVDGVDAFLADPSHRGRLTGRVTIDGVADAVEATGTLSLFASGTGHAMRYELDLVDDAGRPVSLVGTKTQRPGRPLALWPDLTTLYVEAHGADGPMSGTVRLGVRDVVRLTSSLRGDGDRPRTRASAVARFLWFFAGGALRGLLGRS